MSKFFEGLEETPQKKVHSAIREVEGESEEEKPSISNREKKDEEVAKICRETAFKKPKDVEQFFKKLSKYSAHFTKKGLPPVLLEFIKEAEGKKETPSIFKQKMSKFLEKYPEVEVILESVEETKAKRNYLEEITKTYLIENLEKRKKTLLEIEKVTGLSESEKHRINLYLISCMIEENIQESYAEIIRRLKLEGALLSTPEEEQLLRTRVGKYVRKLLKNIQIQDRDKVNWEDKYNDLLEISETLKNITTIPEEGLLELDYFLREKEKPYLSQEFTSKPVMAHNYEQFRLVEEIRRLPYVEALELYRKAEESMKNREEIDESHSVTVCFYKITEELGHRAFEERDFNTAIDLLERSFYSKTIWSDVKTETILEVLCLCFEKRMKDRKFFETFKKNLLVVGENLLLLKSYTQKMEISRAFIFLRLGEYKKASTIITSILPHFDCESLLRARAIEILLTPAEVEAQAA